MGVETDAGSCPLSTRFGKCGRVSGEDHSLTVVASNGAGPGGRCREGTPQAVPRYVGELLER